MLRKRNDSVKPGKGIDGTEGEDFSRDYAVDPWSNYGNRQVPDTQDIKGRRVRNAAGEAAYSPDSDANWLRPDRTDDYQFTAGVRQIWQDVEENQRPGGDDNTDFDTTGPIKSGVNRSQSDGSKDPRRG